jgi:hypothetical protein
VDPSPRRTELEHVVAGVQVDTEAEEAARILRGKDDRVQPDDHLEGASGSACTPRR